MEAQRRRAAKNERQHKSLDSLLEAFEECGWLSDGRRGRSCDFEGVRAAILRNPDSARAKTKNGSTPLHLVCSSHAPPWDIVRLLVERCPEAVEVKDREGKTPLMLRKASMRAYGTKEPQELMVCDLLRFTRYLRNVEMKRASLLFLLREFGAMPSGAELAFAIKPSIAQLALETQPSLVRTLDLRFNLLPRLLSKVGRQCRLATMVGIVKEMPDIFVAAGSGSLRLPTEGKKWGSLPKEGKKV